MDLGKTQKDLKIRNVSLLRRGHVDLGTLRLGQHHLTFSYVPTSSDERSTAISATADAPKTASARQIAVSPNPLRDNNAGISLDRQSSDSTARHKTPEHRPKEKTLWVTYPLINSCVLHPSNSQNNLSYDRNPTLEHQGSEEGDFPPVFGTSSYTRPSTDSARLGPYSSPQRPLSPNPGSANVTTFGAKGREPRLRIRCRDFKMMAFHFHQDGERSADDAAREVFFALRSHCCIHRVQDMQAFHFKAPDQELAVGKIVYEARRELARMGVGSKAAEGPGSAWRITDINSDYSFSPTYPNVLCVPKTVSDNMLKYGGPYRSKARIPALTYLHSNGGSITRSSQPMPGIQGKRNPQDEKLVSAIFTSTTPSQQSPADSPPQLPKDTSEGSFEGSQPTSTALQGNLAGLSLSQSDTALDEKFADNESVPRPKIYGSTRRSMIVDARPRINALANRASGGGIEDVSNYRGLTGSVPERIFLDIPNIHVMRKSLERVVESFANSDYVDLKPDPELLRKSGWLRHIELLLGGAKMVARAIGLGGSHVLLHCSDGWDRTSQVAAIAEVMLDPHYRTLEGFITLIQKDFLSFGHKFEHRNGILGSEKWFEIENERVAPSRPKDNNSNDNKGILGSKAISGAKNWFEKSRGSLFGQANDSRSSLDGSGSRPPSPPPNPVLHAPATTNTSKDREHKIKEDEIAPIFHQFLDAVFQLQHQFPNAFEFNERFLVRLFYHTYASQYGEFLFNNERERSAQTSRFASVWPHFLSRRHEFVNPDFTPKVDDPLLFPQQDVEVRWWSALFGRKDEEMNTPRALAPLDPPNPPSLPVQPSDMSLQGENAEEAFGQQINGTIKETQSLPSFDAVRNSITSTFNSFQTGFSQGETHTAEPRNILARPILEQRETDTEVLARYANSGTLSGDGENWSEAASGANQPVVVRAQMDMDEGDPLGVSGEHKVREASGSRLDFAAFAQGSAFRE